MYLKSLAVREFANLDDASLEGLDPGLNVVVGDNEAGKSTLLKALRAAFFQKFRGRGETVEAFLPYGGEGRPTVCVAFSLAGTDYRLAKSFWTRPSAELDGPWPKPVTGDAVEEKLAALLGFTHPGRGDSKLTEHQGAFGVLWVEQGRSNAGLDIGAGRDAVTASLEGEVGTILGGERGRALIGAAKALNDRHFTATGRIAGNAPLKAIDDELGAARQELDEKRAAFADLDQKLKRLDDRRRALKGYEEAGTVEKAGEALRAAETAVRRAEDRDREWQAAEGALRQAEAIRLAALDALRRRDALLREVEETRTAYAAAAAEHATIDAAAREAVAAVSRARAAREVTRHALKQAESRHEIDRMQIALTRDQAEFRRLTDTVAAAEALSEEIRALSGQRDAIAMDDKTLSALDEAERQLRDCEIRLQVAAPAVTFEPDGAGGVIGPDGKAVTPGHSERVVTPSRFQLDGFGAVLVEPGGGAANLDAAKQRAEDARDALLKQAGAASLDAARLLLTKRQTLHGDLNLLAARRDAIVPHGLDAERARRDAAEAAVRRLEAALASARGEAKAELSLQNNDVDGDGDARLAALDKARRAAEAADRALAAAQSESEAMTLSRVAAESECHHLQMRLERLAEESAETQRAASRARLQDRLADADADCEAKRARVARHRADHDAEGPEAAKARRQAAEKTLRQISETVRQLREDCLGLEGEVRVVGGSGIGEAVQRLKESIADLERWRARVALEADAARLLYTTLVEAQRAAREHWLGPIKTRVAPYLKLLHPNSDVDLDEETLELKALRRAGIAERFERLSAGAREQVAVVTRLALAQVLKQGGHPATVILDDALVNTDEIRLDRMHAVLREAARDLQVIVLTCRERDFRDLGAPMFRL
ncbi:AAA family ATPase [Jiella sp. MQZ9-1]|uniref:AAA family ATPase n=1 Tax=Jiella flava TaxID=2816857 RepID=A0A939FWL7_9HYPH|nr:AAA family ATPase [Jiella flava]MBO0661393.1 AAA family ATPase [Jiella flava]MCD2470037.1 AAA family ATPase [Jiella flava]